jgi:hypothetical protein
MQKAFLLLTIAFLFSLQIHGQTVESKIRELLDLNSYSFDKEAGAVVIYDFGETDFFQNDYGFYTKFTRRLRVKFFNETNLDFSEISIPIYIGERSVEEIEEFNATAYNLNDGIIETTKTTKKELLKETYTNKQYNYKVAVAGIKAGSVMDVEYTVVSPFLFSIQDWQFQYKIPVLYSEYKAHMIPFYTYSYIIKGTTKLDELSSVVEDEKHDLRNVTFQKTVYKFVKTKIPAFYSDDYITSENDYLISLDFQLNEITHLEGYKEQVISTWPKMTEELIKDHADFGGYIKGSKKFAKKALEENTFPHSNNTQYLEKLVEYVKNNFDWNGRQWYYSDVKPSEFERTKKGNASAINLFLLALLREAGITAEPVMISTRDNGKIYTKYPFIHYFNYTIVLANVDGKDYLLDATEKQTYFDQIPSRCINEIGLVVRKGEENWITLSSNNLSNDFNTFFYQLTSTTDSLKCVYSCRETGYYALNSRIKSKDDPEKFLEQRINPMFDEVVNSKIIEADSSRSFRYTATGLIAPTKIDKYISIKPFLNTIDTNSPFKMKERTYPVDFIYARKRIFSAQIQIPEGAKLAKVPESIDINNANFMLKYDVIVTDNAILVNAEYSLKKPVFEPTLYPGLKNMYDNLVKFLNQNIEIQLP